MAPVFLEEIVLLMSRAPLITSKTAVLFLTRCCWSYVQITNPGTEVLPHPWDVMISWMLPQS
ncbi:hypothetical protein ANCCAN_14245 [Ancylostoma caninum]|uniref:Uncharacterized protein n=1 Tax=Ancylostoma caninum TaxID=29170 RepID=A0A368G5V5_ANCCA|nr:hypothetical protein ANCCAN_14245 [Ancylostoma caninum]